MGRAAESVVDRPVGGDLSGAVESDLSGAVGGDLRADVALIDALAAQRRVVSRAQAREVALMLEFADVRRRWDQHRIGDLEAEGRDARYTAGEFAAVEIAMAVTASKYSVCQVMAVARRLRAETPDAYDAWQAGEIDHARAARINRALLRLTRHDSKQLLNACVVDVAVCRTAELLGRWLNEFVAKVEPDQTDERMKRSLDDRYVSVRPDLDGISFLSAAVASVDASAVDQVLTALAAAAAPDDPRTMQQRRADALVDVLLGRVSNGCHVTWVDEDEDPHGRAGAGRDADAGSDRNCGDCRGHRSRAGRAGDSGCSAGDVTDTTAGERWTGGSPDHADAEDANDADRDTGDGNNAGGDINDAGGDTNDAGGDTDDADGDDADGDTDDADGDTDDADAEEEADAEDAVDADSVDADDADNEDWELPSSAFRPEPRPEAGGPDFVDERTDHDHAETVAPEFDSEPNGGADVLAAPDVGDDLGTGADPDVGSDGDPSPASGRRGRFVVTPCPGSHQSNPVPAVIGVIVSVQSLFGFSNTPGQLADRSALVTADAIRDLAQQPGTLFHRLLTDERGNLLDVTELGRFPSRKLGLAVNYRDGVCVRPGCHTAAAHCDHDHFVPVPQGPTTGRNLGPACRPDHRAKTHAGHDITRIDDHSIRWTTPTGHEYLNQNPPLPVETLPTAAPSERPDQDAGDISGGTQPSDGRDR